MNDAASLDPTTTALAGLRWRPATWLLVLAFLYVARSAAAAPAAALSAVGLDFDKQALGDLSLEKMLTVTNTGDADLLIRGLALAGESARFFRITEDRCTRATVHPGQSCSVRIQYAPGSMTPDTANLAIMDNALDGRQTIELRGAGIGPAGTGPAILPCLLAQIPALLDFDGAAAGDVVFNQFDGVTFVNGDLPPNNGTHPIVIARPARGTVSGLQAAQGTFLDPFNRNPLPGQPGGGLLPPSGSHLVMRFDQLQCQVGLSTGLAAAFTGAAGFSELLQGFSDTFTLPVPGGAIDGTPVAESETACLGMGPTPVTTPLQIQDAQGRIRYAVLSLVPCARTPGGTGAGPSAANLGPSSSPIVLDNLTFDRPSHPVAHENAPPIIAITEPANGSTELGSLPNVVSARLSVTVTEDSLRTLSASVNGGPTIPMMFWRFGAGTYLGSGTMDAATGLHTGTNTVVVTATDFDQPSNTGTASSTFTFQTLAPLPPPVTQDVVPVAYEVTQTIDPGPQILTTADLNPTADGFRVTVSGAPGPAPPTGPPLLRGKATLVRIYGAVNGAPGAVNHVPAAADVSVEGTGFVLATAMPPVKAPAAPAPPPPCITASPNPQGILLGQAGTAAADPTSSANLGTLASTWNFLLPADWTSQDLVVTVRVNDGRFGAPPMGVSVPECTFNTSPMDCSTNNTVELHLRFADTGTITVNPVFLHLQGIFKGMPVNVTPTQSQVDAMFCVWNELYPVHVQQGATSVMTLSPSDDKGDVKDDIEDLDDPGAHTFNLGVYPGGAGGLFGANEATAATFVSGYATVGGHGAWADADMPADPAHEIGHNIGFDHWACENGVSADECGLFPIPHGGIGIVGTDLANWSVLLPGDTSTNATPHAHDFMTYGSLCSVMGNGGAPGCDTGTWVSWYTYGILQDHFDADSYDTNDPPALLVRGVIGSDGAATMRPVYQAQSTQPIEQSTDDDLADRVTLGGYDAGGNTLFVHSFEPQKVSDHEPGIPEIRPFREMVPWAPTLGRLALLRDGRLLGEMKNPAPGRKLVVNVTSPAAKAVWPVGAPQAIHWTVAAAPAAGTTPVAQIQYSADGGVTRRTLARDVRGDTFPLNPDELAGSDNAVVYVQVSDGLNFAEGASAPFTVAPKPPTAHIVGPIAGAAVSAQVPVVLDGAGFDRQQDLDDRQFVWSSDRDGILGTGRHAAVSRLSPGKHILTLSVTDHDGLSGQESVPITVEAAEGAPPPAKGTATVRVRSVSGLPGETVAVEVDADALAQNLSGAEVTLQFGGLGRVDLKGLRRGSLVAGPDATAAGSDTIPGQARLALLGSAPRGGPGPLVLLPLKIDPEALPGTYPLALTHVLLSDAAGHAIPSRAVAGTLTVGMPPGSSGNVVALGGAGFAGRPVTMSLTADDRVASFAGATFTLRYDPSLGLAPADVQPGALLAAPQIAVNAGVPGEARISLLASRPFRGPGELLRLTFHLPADALPGAVYPVTLVGVAAADGGGKPIRLAFQGAGLRVLPRQAGDVNGDGTVDVRDAVLALRAIVGLAPVSADELVAGDLANTGKITVVDVTGILRAALGLKTP